MTATVPILMYHEVADRPATASPLAVPPAAFAAQLAVLADAGFAPVTASALAGAIAGGTPLPPRPVVITFDDGYADFHTTALPLLAAHGFAATVFVTPGWIRDAGPAARPRPGPMLSWQQVVEAAGAGVEIGAHSLTHPQLDQLHEAGLNRELRMSKSVLEDRLAGPVTGMAYPFGYSSARVRRAVRAAGYRYACAVTNRVAVAAPDLFALPRLTVQRSTSLRTFQRIVRSERLLLIYARERSLTRGYAMVRRTRAVLCGMSRAA